MPDKQERIVSFIISASGVILGAIIGYAMNVSPDFIVFMDDIADTRMSEDNFLIDHNISLYDEHMFKKYGHPIILEASSLDGSALPNGLAIDFEPAGGRIPFCSTAHIVISDMQIGVYKIKITAFGGDGKERSCPYLLHIKKEQ